MNDYEPTAAEIPAYAARILSGLHEITADQIVLAMLAYLIDLARQGPRRGRKGRLPTLEPTTASIWPEGATKLRPKVGETFMLVKGKVFREQRLRMDGKTFDDCTFDRCMMVYSGMKPSQLIGGTIDSCSWDFDGPALNVFRFLVMVEQNGGAGLVDDIFRKVRHSAVVADPRRH